MNIKPSISGWIFLLLGITLFGFVFLVPPFQKPDEEVHFYRALSLAQGNIFCRTPTGNNVKLNTSTQYFISRIHAMNLPLHKENKFDATLYRDTLVLSDRARDVKNYSVDYQCNYPLISYIPQVTGMLLGTLFTHNGLIIFFLGRAIMALVTFIWILLMYRKIAHGLRPLFLTVVFTPVLLQQVTAFSYDGVHILLALTCFIFVVNQSKNVAGFFITVLLLLLAKPSGYEFFSLLLLVHIFRSGNAKRKELLTKTVLIFCLLGVLYGISKFSLFAGYGEGERLRTDISPIANMFSIVQNPFSFVKLLIATTIKRSVFYIQSTIGILGWLEYSVGLFGYMAYGALAGYSLLLTTFKEYAVYSKRFIITLSVVIGATYILLLTMFFILWTPSGAGYIDGVQGRYFLPFLPLVYLAISYIRQRLYPRELIRNNPLLMIILLFFVTATTLAAVFVRYY